MMIDSGARLRDVPELIELVRANRAGRAERGDSPAATIVRN